MLSEALRRAWRAFCWLRWCPGYVDREIDAAGIEWIGHRCALCGRLNSAVLSKHQWTKAGKRALAEAEGRE